MGGEMATQQEILSEIQKAQVYMGSAYEMVRTTNFPTEGIPVHNGENLLQKIQDNPEDSTFILDTDFVQDVGQCVIPKPCSIKGQGSAKLVNAAIDARPRDVKFFGVVIDGKDQVTILATGPATFVEDSVLNGHPHLQHRGILCNTEGCRVLRTKVLNIKKWQDTQAISGFAGTKDLIIDDCDLEASGENIMFGGDTTPSASAIPRNIYINNTRMFKKLEWRADPEAGCKNLFELKECEDLLMENCTFEYSFVDAQIGYAMVLSVRNQYGRSPWAVIKNVMIRNNTFRHTAGGVSILGRDDIHPSEVMDNVTLLNNRFEDINQQLFGGNGRQVFISGGPRNLRLEQNYFDGGGTQLLNTAFSFDRCGPPENLKAENLQVIANRFVEGNYGMHAQDGPALGEAAINFAAPGYTWTGPNTVKRSGVRTIKWPANTVFETA